MIRVRSVLLSVCAVLLALLPAVPALAVQNYGNFNGLTVDFIGVSEATNTGDTEPLFGAPDDPAGASDQLVFNPLTFSASSSGGSGIDDTGALLSFEIQAALGQTIDVLTIQEFGDITITQFPPGSGTAATGGTVAMLGDIIVLETTAGAVFEQIDISGLFNPQGAFPFPSGTYLDAPTFPGGTNWAGIFQVDIAQVLADRGVLGLATRVQVQLDNQLSVNSEATTSVVLQKKAVGGVIITVPEPTSLALVGLGLLAAGLMGRRRDQR